MAGGCGADGIDRLYDPVQRRVCPYRHIRAAEVIVDGADYTDYIQLSVRLSLLLRYLTWRTRLASMYG